jgi:hypothetical protein
MSERIALHRRTPRPTLKVLEDSSDRGRILDAADDLHFPATVLAMGDVNLEHSLE